MTSELQFRPITSSLGALVEGADLGKPLALEAVRALRGALTEHGVVFFRGQVLSADR